MTVGKRYSEGLRDAATGGSTGRIGRQAFEDAGRWRDRAASDH